LTHGVTIESLALHRGPKYAYQAVTGRSRGAWVDDRLFDAQGRSYTFVEHFSGELVVAAEDGRPVRFKPKQLGYYVILINRTERGLAKERLRSFWES
jgi:hypothetical protein